MFHFLPGSFNGTACLEQYLEDRLQVSVLADRIVEAVLRKLTFHHLGIHFVNFLKAVSNSDYMTSSLTTKKLGALIAMSINCIFRHINLISLPS